MSSCVRMIFLFIAYVLAAGCASAPTVPSQPAPPASAAARHDAATATAIAQVLAAPERSAADRAQDAHRHPLETLLFFGIKPDMTVVETWPGTGWYTAILAPLLSGGGKLYAAQPPAAPGNEYVTAALAGYRARLAASPAVYGKVELTTLGPIGAAIAPPGSVDLVVTYRNLHTWMNLGFANEAFASIFKALKPGGILGVVESRGDVAKPQDPRAARGYVDEAYAVKSIEAAGFELVDRSEINANPKDTKDYEQGVWALPPDYRLGNRERAKYEAIGESDRFTLKFRKPR